MEYNYINNPQGGINYSQYNSTCICVDGPIQSIINNGTQTIIYIDRPYQIIHGTPANIYGSYPTVYISHQNMYSLPQHIQNVPAIPIIPQIPNSLVINNSNSFDSLTTNSNKRNIQEENSINLLDSNKRNKVNPNNEEEQEEQEEQEQEEEQSDSDNEDGYEVWLDDNYIETEDSRRIVKFIKKNDLDGLRRALSNGLDVNTKIKFHNFYDDELVSTTAINVACILKDIELVRLLLSYGPDINIEDFYGLTGIVYASRHNRLDIVRLLLAHDPNIKLNFDEDNLFQISFSNNNIDMVLEIVNNDPTFKIASNFNNWDMEEPFLILACQYFDSKKIELTEKLIKIVTYFIDAGEDINCIYDDYFPLGTAVVHGGLELVKLLIERGADINKQDSNGNTALMLALQEKVDVKITKYLIEQGADIFIKNKLPLLLYCLEQKGLLESNKVQVDNICEISEYL